MATSAGGFSDLQAVSAVPAVLGNSRWVAVTLARAILAANAGEPVTKAARVIYDESGLTLGTSIALLQKALADGFVATLPQREKTGSAVSGDVPVAVEN